MTNVFLSPSDQDNNPVHGGGNEQQYAQTRCLAAAQELLAAGVNVRISQTGIGDDSAGYIAAVAESNYFKANLHIADHTNAVGSGATKRRGIVIYAWLPDPDSVALAHAIGRRVSALFWDGHYSVADGSHLYEVNGPNCTAVLLELGYHDHPDDAYLIRTYPVEMGRAVGQGVLDFLGLNNQEDAMGPITYIGPDNQEYTAPAETVLAYLIGNTHTLLRQVSELLSAVTGRGLPVMDSTGQPLPGISTDLATEAAWNRVNMAAAGSLSEADAQRLADLIAQSRVTVDVRVDGIQR